MAWPSSPGFVTTNLDAGTDSPASARSDIKNALDDVSDMIAARGAANGVAGLDSSGKVPPSQLPAAVANGGSGVPQAILAWTDPGTYLWTVPAGVTRICAEVYGAGGGGSNGASAPGTVVYGGGSGGYAKASIPVTPGDSVTIIVGTGGSPGSGTFSASCSGTAGGNTNIITGAYTVAGAGGGGGLAVGYGAANGAGGAISGHQVGRQGAPGFGEFGGSTPFVGFNPAGTTYGGGGGCGLAGNGPAYAGLNGLAIISY